MQLRSLFGAACSGKETEPKENSSPAAVEIIVPLPLEEE
jgi:hypothetical protein